MSRKKDKNGFKNEAMTFPAKEIFLSDGQTRATEPVRHQNQDLQPEPTVSAAALAASERDENLRS